MPNPQKTFWSQVDKSGDCWIWTGRTDPDGYGKYRLRLKEIRAPRYAFEEANGPLPAGLLVCHRCDNPPCVRPDHLFAGTPADNTHDMWAKGRAVVTTPPRSIPKKTPPAVRAEMVALRRAGATQKAIGRHFGLSQAYVSKLLKEIA